MNAKINIADWITISRLLIAPFLFYSIFVLNNFLFFIFFFLSVISDIMDGLIARKHGKTGKSGERLDSFVDFFWINGSLIVLAIKNLIPYYFFLIYLIPLLIFLKFKKKIDESKFLKELCPFAVVIPVAYINIKTLTNLTLVLISITYFVKYLLMLKFGKKLAKHI